MYNDEQGLFDSIIAKAAHHEVNPAKIAVCDYQLPVGSHKFWWKPQQPAESDSVYVDNIDLISGHDDVLSRFVSSLADSIQFPKSTAMLHGLGTVSAAMTNRFFYLFNGSQENTVGLYTVGAQPPSTGKSAIDSYLTEPAHEAYRELNKNNEVVRAKLAHKIGKLKASIKKAGEQESLSMVEELVELEREMAAHPIYIWAVNDPTPEGCEKILAAQGGFFNVVSDESSAVSVILGMVYGDGAKNNGVFLKAWDNGFLSVARAGRDGFVGRIRGAMAVLAQDASVNAILNAGQGGEGISERFLIISEPNLLGDRDHTHYKPVCKQAKTDYAALINNIVMQPWNVNLTLSESAESLVRSAKQDQEPLMRDGGRFSSAMLRGVVGKNEKQIIKLACVLHTIDQWAAGGERSTVIEMPHVLRAIMIFNQLLKTYVASADNHGYTGQRTELAAIIATLKKMAEKNKLTTDIRTLRDHIKNLKSLKTVPKLTDKIRKDYIPLLESTAHIVHNPITDAIFINPYLKD